MSHWGSFRGPLGVVVCRACSRRSPGYPKVSAAWRREIVSQCFVANVLWPCRGQSCLARRSLLLTFRLRSSEIKFLWRQSWSSATFECTLARKVLSIENLRSPPASVHAKMGCKFGPSYLTLLPSSRPSSAHPSAFSSKNSPPWALILLKMEVHPLLKHVDNARQYVTVGKTTVL